MKSLERNCRHENSAKRRKEERKDKKGKQRKEKKNEGRKKKERRWTKTGPNLDAVADGIPRKEATLSFPLHRASSDRSLCLPVSCT